MTHEDICTLEQSKELYRLGFDWHCHRIYNTFDALIGEASLFYTNEGFENMPLAPTLAQVQKWIYEKFGIWIEPAWNVIEDGFVWIARWIKPFYNGYNDEASKIRFETPTEALSSGIDRVLEIIKDS